MSSNPGRLIPLHSCEGAVNMATDQALSESVASSGLPALRFYQWRQPTLSLGYFQPVSLRTDHGDSSSLPCVRRATGGGAIVHDLEVTYSLSIPCPLSSTGPRLDLYQKTHQCLIEALSEFGVKVVPFRTICPDAGPPGQDPFLCFRRRSDEDLILHGYKIVGSAQRKVRSAILQHGSVLLRSSRWAPQLPGIEDLTSRIVPIPELIDCFVGALEKSLSVRWNPDQLDEQEKVRIQSIVEERFGNEDWFSRR